MNEQMPFDFENPMNRRTFGPAFDPKKDGVRVGKQHEVIRDFMLTQNEWLTLAEIENAVDYPQASVSAQLRHLRKPKFGAYRVEKRRRTSGGTWEYAVLPPEVTA